MQNISADNYENIEKIVHTYGDTLYRLCYIMLQSRSDAEDAVQDTFIKYIQKKPKLNDSEHTKAWLITVAKNECRDLLRYRQKHLHFDIDEVIEIPKQEEADSDILEALMDLPEKFRIVLTLYYVEDMKIEEIAKIIGRTQSAVKMRLQKGRRLLKEKYLNGGKM